MGAGSTKRGVWTQDGGRSGLGGVARLWEIGWGVSVGVKRGEWEPCSARPGGGVRLGRVS